MEKVRMTTIKRPQNWRAAGRTQMVTTPDSGAPIATRQERIWATNEDALVHLPRPGLPIRELGQAVTTHSVVAMCCVQA